MDPTLSQIIYQIHAQRSQLEQYEQQINELRARIVGLESENLMLRKADAAAPSLTLVAQDA